MFAAVGAFAALAAAAAVHAEPTDADFLAARDAFLANDAAALENRAAGKGSFARALTSLGTGSCASRWTTQRPARRSFLERNDGTPLADTLRGPMVEVAGQACALERVRCRISEAQRRRYRACLLRYAVAPRNRSRGSVGGRTAVLVRRPDQPESCQPLFAELQATGGISTSDVWSRFRLAHEAGNFRLAARLVGDLPVNDRPAAADYDWVEHNAGPALAKGEFRFGSRSGREIALYALDRVARSDADAAHRAWLRWRARLPEADLPSTAIF